MKNPKSAGASGKSFYTALTLSVAMVGAACWYAYSQTGRITPPKVSETSLSSSRPGVTVSDAAALTTTAAVMTTTQGTTTVTVTTTTPEPAEDVAAILHPALTTASVSTSVTAATPAPVELPLPPVDGAVLKPFSGGELVKSETTGIWATHNGTDYAASVGTDVRCALAGTVIAVERDALWGIRVVLLHEDGTVTKYCGLSEGLNVEAGQLITRGTVLGAVGESCEAESGLPAHLHFEVLQNDTYTDPEAWLAGQ